MLHIYGLPFSSPTNKVRYAANYLQIPYEFHYIELGSGQQRTAEFLKINPFGKIPAIDDQGFKLSESNAIIRYLADKQKSPLYPQELQQRANVDRWLDYASMHVAMATSKIMFNTFFYKATNIAQDERSLQDGRNFLGQYLPIIEKQLEKTKFIAGDKITLADIAMLSALDVCDVIKIDFSSFPKIQSWRKNLMAESFYRDCHESYTAMFNKLMNEAASKQPA